jgi:tRNA dimethylallyltransferase
MVEMTVVPKILIVQGPTASGKSDLAIRLAESFSGEIVNADSMQIYRRMDIGTAKPSPEQLRRVPHHLLDTVDPDQPFSASDFCRAADAAIAGIISRGKRVIVCGGTGLYIRALTKGLLDSPGGDEALRDELRAYAETAGSAALHARLAHIDPGAALLIHPNDQFRIIRALELCQITGRPVSELRSEHGFAQDRYRTLKIGLDCERAKLYDRIDARVELMLQNGFVAEVHALLSAGYSHDLKPLRSLGYRQLCDYLRGELSLDDAVTLIKRDTRHYAKRQLTWFRRDGEINWIEYPENVAIIERIVDDFFD